MSTAVSLLSPADYEAIEAAVMETARGRWFLAEYGRRHRNADTQMLLEAMSRLEDVVRNESVAAGDRVRSGLLDMSAAIARTKADIAALKPEGETGRIEEATEELDSVVSATETATGDILAAAEHIQEIAWTLRERPLETSHCDALDSLATDIYTACSFQDLTGQRTRKVINVLRYLESRIDAMIDLWGRPEPSAAQAREREAGDRALLNGPARPGQGLDQADIDSMMGLDPAPVAPALIAIAPHREEAKPSLELDEPILVDDVVWVTSEDAEPEAEPDPAEDFALAMSDPATDMVDIGEVASETPPQASRERDALAALVALSREEKIALFT